MEVGYSWLQLGGRGGWILLAGVSREDDVKEKIREHGMGPYRDKVCTFFLFICILEWVCNGSSKLIVCGWNILLCTFVFLNTSCFGFFLWTRSRGITESMSNCRTHAITFFYYYM